MRHMTIDHYAAQSSFYKFDPRIKISVIIFFIVAVTLLMDLLPLLVALSCVISLHVISQIPFKHIMKRYAIALPFIFFASVSFILYGEPISSFVLFLRISTCVLLLILLSSTTPFFDLLLASQKLKVPKLMVTLSLFLYRYLFVFTDEYHRMKMARTARAYSKGRHILDKRTMRTISHTVGMLLVRAYDRGVRIYDALLVRGYDGNIRTLTKMRIKGIDYAFAFNLIIFAFFVLWMDWMVI
jgi:cobalt/nickel transport system permease protein